MLNINKIWSTEEVKLGQLTILKMFFKDEYVFVPEDNLWYIDMPWPGDRYNLAMVAGSNKLLDSKFIYIKKECSSRKV